MKILSLEAENIKYLKAISIKPDGSLVVIGGDNAQGKSCVLDAIEYALHGAGAIPSKPIRQGKDKARVVLDLGDIEVVRTFTGKGTNLTVKNKDGAKYPSPQAMLDKLVGQISFDPLEFSRMDAKKQSDVLKRLVGLDFTTLDNDYKKVFDERTDVNRRGRDLKGQLDNMVLYDDVPDEEVSIQELSRQYTEATVNNNLASDLKNQLDRDKEELAKLEQRVKELKNRIKDNNASLKKIEVVDTTAIQKSMEEAETTNNRIRSNKKFKEVESILSKLRKQSTSLSNKLNSIVANKESMLENAKFPIKGLGVSEDGVTFNGIPFDQCSTAQKIKVSVAIGLSMNPKLKVLLVREGSLLDPKNLKMISDMASKVGAQIWVERVSQGKECQIIIEDGSVKGAKGVVSV